MERHPVPQNIMDVEFKLFGALTVKQFAYAAAGFICALISYYTPFPDILRLIFIGVSIGAGLFLSLVKINGQPSTIWVSNFLVSMVVPQERLWRKSAIIPEILQDNPALKDSTDTDLADTLTKERLDKLPSMPLENLSPAETELDQEEEKNLKQIDEHFDFLFNQLPQVSTTSVNPGVQEAATSFKKENLPVPEAALPVIKKPNSIAEAVGSNYGQDKVYVNDSYAVPFKKVTKEVNRPMNLTDNTKPIVEPVKQVPVVDPASLPVQPGMVNLVNGSVTDKQGQPLSGVKLSVLDQSGKMVRSVNSSGQGSFTLASGMNNGKYILDAAKDGYKFTRYTIDLKGDRILTIKITAQ